MLVKKTPDLIRRFYLCSDDQSLNDLTQIFHWNSDKCAFGGLTG